jgi:hypothetical protein
VVKAHFIWRCDKTKQFSPLGEKFGCRVAGTQTDFRGDFDHMTPSISLIFNSELAFLYFPFNFCKLYFFYF